MEPKPSSPADLSESDLSVLQRLRAAFAQLPDCRQPSKVLHRLDEVLMCSFCAVLCDADGFTDMEDFAESQLPWLRRFLTLEHGAPSHDVFRNVFMMLHPQTLLDILSQWCGSLQGLHVAVDGKTLRGTYDAELGRHRVHLLRAWVDAHSLSAGQVVCEEKSNEVEAIPRLLAAMDLRGASVTIDAMGTQTAIAAQIHEAGADYVLALKANQKNAMAAVQTAFGDKRKKTLVAGEPTLPSPPRREPCGWRLWNSPTGAANGASINCWATCRALTKAGSGKGCRLSAKCAARCSAATTGRR